MTEWFAAFIAAPAMGIAAMAWLFWYTDRADSPEPLPAPQPERQAEAWQSTHGDIHGRLVVGAALRVGHVD